MREFIVVEPGGAERKFWITSYTSSANGTIELRRDKDTVGVIPMPYAAAYYAEAAVQPPAETGEAAE